MSLAVAQPGRCEPPARVRLQVVLREVPNCPCNIDGFPRQFRLQHRILIQHLSVLRRHRGCLGSPGTRASIFGVSMVSGRDKRISSATCGMTSITSSVVFFRNKTGSVRLSSGYLFRVVQHAKNQLAFMFRSASVAQVRPYNGDPTLLRSLMLRCKPNVRYQHRVTRSTFAPRTYATWRAKTNAATGVDSQSREPLVTE